MKNSMKKQPEKPFTGLSVAELASILNCPFEGKGDTVIHAVSSLEKAKEGDLVFLADRKSRSLLENTRASAAIIPTEEKFDRIPVIRSKNPHLSFIKVLDLFYKAFRLDPGIHPQAFVSKSAKIGKDVSIGAFTVIGDDAEISEGTTIFPLVSIYPGVKIGRKTVIHSHVSIREECRIGDRVIIHNSAVIGSDGFGYIQEKDGSHVKIPQKGIVIIEDDVEVGANSAIDRAALGETIIKKGTKIDNLVQIAHNIEIGPNCILAGQTGIGGSTKVGKNVVMAGQVGITDHVTIGDDVIIAAKTGITKSIPRDSIVAGIPHMNINDWRKAWASMPHLYELLREVRKLKKRIEELERTNK